MEVGATVEVRRNANIAGNYVQATVVDVQEGAQPCRNIFGMWQSDAAVACYWLFCCWICCPRKKLYEVQYADGDVERNLAEPDIRPLSS